jgi:hypothetical protein
MAPGGGNYRSPSALCFVDAEQGTRVALVCVCVCVNCYMSEVPRSRRLGQPGYAFMRACSQAVLSNAGHDSMVWSGLSLDMS